MPENVILDSSIFWVFAALSIISALGVVTHRSIIYAALLLIVVFMSIAGLFVLNNADFLAIAQTIVYAVGLTIILVFGVMFTGDRSFKDGLVPRRRYIIYAIITMFALGVLVRGAIYPYAVTPTPDFIVQILEREGSTGMLGNLLFSRYALPFEVASILLLVAMVGAIILAKKKFESEDELMGQTRFAINVESELNPEAEIHYEAQYKKITEESKPKAAGSSSAATDDDIPEEDASSEMVGAK